MDLLESANPVIDWVACSLELTVGTNLYTVLALLVNTVSNIAQSSLE